MNQIKTEPVDKLYHKFLKSLNISRDQTLNLARLLSNDGFIDFVPGSAPDLRYTETEKLSDKSSRNQLFKIVHSLKG